MTPIQGKTNNELLSLIAGFYIENEKKETKDKQEEKKVSSLVGGTIKKIGASGEELKSVGSGITSLVAGCLSFYKNRKKIEKVQDLLVTFVQKLAPVLNTLKPENLVAFTSFFTMLGNLNINISKILSLYFFMKVFTQKRVKGLVDAINELSNIDGKNLDKLPPLFDSVSKLLDIISKMVIKIVVVVAVLSLLLAFNLVATLGAIAIVAGIFVGLYWFIKKLAKIKQKDITTSENVIKMLTNCLLIITASILAISLGIRLIGLANVLISLVAVEVILFSLYFILKLVSKLSGDEKNKSLEESRKTLIVLVGVLSIVSFIAAFILPQIGKHFGDVLLGVLVVTAIMAILIGIVFILTNKLKKNENILMGVIIMGALAAILGLVSLIVRFFIIPIGKEDQKAVWLGIGAVLGILAGIIGMTLLISALMKNPISWVAVVIIAVLTVCLIGIVFVVKQIVNIILELKKDDLGWLDLLNGIGKISTILISLSLTVSLMAVAGILAIPGLIGIGVIWLSLFLIKKIINQVKEISKILKGFNFKDTLDDITEILLGIDDAISAGLHSNTGNIETGNSTGNQIMNSGLVKMIGKIIGGGLNTLGNMALFASLVSLYQEVKFTKAIIEISFKMIKEIIKNYDQNTLSTFVDDLTNPKTGLFISMQTIMKNLVDVMKDISMFELSNDLYMIDELYRSISKFMDIISKVANLRYIESYDKNNNPHYATLSLDDFKLAATNVSVGFGTFITELGKGFGSYTDFINETIQDLDDNMDNIMDALSDFVDCVIKLEKLQIPNKWDKNGNAIQYISLSYTDFEVAADSVSKGFGTFITELGKGFSGYSDEVKSTIQDLDDNMSNIMDAVSNFVDAVIKVSTMTVADKWDKDGKPIHYKHLNPNIFGIAATKVSGSFRTFVENLGVAFSSISPFVKDTIEDLDDNMKPIVESVALFIDTVLKLVSYQYIDHYDENGKPVYKKITNNDFMIAATTVGTMFLTFITDLKNTIDEKNITEEATDVMKELGKSVKPVFDSVKTFIDTLLVFEDPKLNYPIKGYDTNGNPIFDKTHPIDVVKLSANLSAIYIRFLHNISNDILANNDLYKFVADNIDNVKDVMKGSLDITKTMIQISQTLMQSKGTGKLSATTLAVVNSLNNFSNLTLPQNVDTMVTAFNKFNGSVGGFINHLDWLRNRSNLVTKSLDKSTEAFKKLDNYIKERSHNRSAAFQEYIKNIKGVEKSLDELTTKLEKISNIDLGKSLGKQLDNLNGSVKDIKVSIGGKVENNQTRETTFNSPNNTQNQTSKGPLNINDSHPVLTPYFNNTERVVLIKIGTKEGEKIIRATATGLN